MPSRSSIKASFKFVSVEAILSIFFPSKMSARVQTTGSVTKALLRLSYYIGFFIERFVELQD
jgi:hypothetical protein